MAVKMKGISVFERFVDKAVFAVFAVFLVVVLAMQLGLLGGGKSIKVEDRAVPLDQADAAVRSLAERKAAALESTQVVEGVPATLPSALERFRAAMTPPRERAPVLADLGAPAILGGAGSDSIIDTLPATTSLYAVFTPPAPEQPLASVYGGTIDPVIVERVGPELAKLVPAQQPFDLRFITVQSAYDAAGLRELLSGTGENNGTPLPENFWRSRVEILDVELVRQERQSDGGWGPEAVVPPMPGAPTLRERLAAAGSEAPALRGVLDTERAARQFIRRPPIYPMISGELWTPPAQALGLGRPVDEQQRIDGLVRQLRSVRAEIEQVTRQRDRQRERSHMDLDADDGSFRWPRLTQNWFAQRDRDRDRDTPPPPRRGAEGDPIETRLTALRARESEVLSQLQALGVGPDGRSLTAVETTEPLSSLTEGDLSKVTLWAHDLTARPGGTYRYKVRLRLTNQFFGQGQALVEEQQPLAEGVSLLTGDSEWTDPVTLPEARLMFVRSATEPRRDIAPAPARASLEMYEFFYGYWRRAEVSLQPGDTTRATLTLPSTLRTFTMNRPEGGGQATVEEQPVPVQRELAFAEYLIDVTGYVGQEGEAQVITGTEDGRVKVRPPVSDPRQQEVRRRLEKSAQLAQASELLPPGSQPWGSDPAGGGGRPPAAPPPSSPPSPPPTAPPGDRD